MGCLISCLACQAASCAGRGCMSCAGKASQTIGGRIVYTIVFFLTSFLAWIFRNWGDVMLKKIPEIKLCKDKECFGVLSVYRVTFALVIFHLVQAFLMIGVRSRKDYRASFQDGYWGLKLFLLAGLIVGSFFIPNEFFEYYGWVALGASGIFIIVQLLLLIDFAHSWAENWIRKYEDTMHEHNGWWWAMLICTGIMYLCSLVLTILMYVFFCKDAAKCQLNVAFITINVILCICISFLAIHPRIQEFNPRSGVLQSGLVSLYTTYLVWSSLISEPTSDCNPYAAKMSAASQTSLLIGALFTIVVVCYSTFRAATTVGHNDETEPLNKEEKAEKKEESDDEDEKTKTSEPVTYNYAMYHLIFALGAFYMCMLMSDWFTVDKTSGKYIQVDSGFAAVWVKMVSSWLSTILYIWTLAGPFLFPDRDWGIQTDSTW